MVVMAVVVVAAVVVTSALELMVILLEVCHITMMVMPRASIRK